MVAPSLEMVTEPLSSWMSLSIPRGPSVVLTTSATAVQALMLLTNCALPCEVSVPSFKSMICGCIMAAIFRVLFLLKLDSSVFYSLLCSSLILFV